MITLRKGNPEAAEMWAQDLNGGLTPDDVGVGSDKPAYFRCLDNPKHVFPKKISKMTSSRDGHNIGCKYCGPNAKEAFPGENDLFTVCPQAKDSWNHEQNSKLGLNPLKLLKGCNKYAHFICSNGHDEFRKVCDYVKAPECQVCAHSLLVQAPVTMQFLDSDMTNAEDIKDYIVSDRRAIHLQCPQCNYRWKWRIGLWFDRQCCPQCGYDGTEGSGENPNKFKQPKQKKPMIRPHKKISLFEKVPEAERFWDRSKNILDPNLITTSCKETAFYYCPECSYEWSDKVDTFSKTPSCPRCRMKEKNISVKNPKALAFWDFDKNILDPLLTGIYSNSDSFWKCPDCGYCWNDIINRFATLANPKCPNCGNVEFEESYAYKNPDAAALWNIPLCNGMTPENTTKSSTKEVYLNCYANKHKPYPIRVCDIPKISPFGCPECIAEAKAESLKKYGLRYAVPEAEEMWDHGKNEMLLDDAKTYMSDSAWFKCSEGHSFPRTISLFAENPACPICSKDVVAKYPQMVKFWDFKKNRERGLDINLTSASSKDYAAWRCKKCGYSWETQISSRKASSGRCPCCEERVVVFKGLTDLFTVVPEIEPFYDWDTNPETDPYMLSVTSSETINWKCPDCGHKWPASPQSRLKKEGDNYILRDCPSCSGRKRTRSYALDYPELIERFCDEKNACTLFDIFSTNDGAKTYFWHCDICGDDFPATVHAMIRSRHTEYKGCVYCAGKQVLRKNSFAALHPEVMDEFDDSNTVDPYTVTEFSSLSAVWKCSYDPSHLRWPASFDQRAKGQGGCPTCRNYHYGTMFKDEHPSLEKYYDIAKNDRPFHALTNKCNDLLWWKCDLGHSFERRPYNFSEDQVNCPYCEDRQLLTGFNDLATRRPDLLVYYDRERNPFPPEQLLINSQDWSIWWTCGEGHHFQRSVARMCETQSCTICDRKLVVSGINDAETAYPKIKSVWDYEKNSCPPSKISDKCQDRYYYRCEYGHSYEAFLSTMASNDFECLICNNVMIVPGINSLIDTHPELCLEISPNEERDPSTVSKNMTYAMLWKCGKCGGDYHYPICDRELGDDDCPFCNGRYTKLGVNSLVDTHPELAKEYSGANDYSVERVNKNTISKAKWICPTCNGEYWYPVNEREVGDDSCPYCKGERLLPGYNSLETVLSDIDVIWADSNEQHYSEYLPTYTKYADWKCTVCGGIYSEAVNSFIEKHLKGEDDCPYCNGRRALTGFNTLETVLDDIESVWSVSNERNYTETLPTLSAMASWRCTVCGGEYSEAVNSFIKKHLKGEDDCPYCNGRRALRGFNTLKAASPSWFDEWSYQNNYLLCDPDEILPNYLEKVWWDCRKCGHEFYMSPKDRGVYEMRNKTACPYCKGRRRKKRYFF